MNNIQNPITKEIKSQMQAMLEEVVLHFASNPNELRSVSKGSNYFNSKCLYHPPADKPKSIGCAIGMYIDWEDAKKLDEYLFGSIKYTIDSPRIPNWMKALPIEFLSSIQDFHDEDRYFTQKGLSEEGIAFVKNICDKFSLNFSPIKKALKL